MQTLPAEAKTHGLGQLLQRHAARGFFQAPLLYAAGISLSKASFWYVIWLEVDDLLSRDLIRAPRATRGMGTTGTEQRRTMMANTQSG